MFLIQAFNNSVRAVNMNKHTSNSSVKEVNMNTLINRLGKLRTIIKALVAKSENTQQKLRLAGQQDLLDGYYSTSDKLYRLKTVSLMEGNMSKNKSAQFSKRHIWSLRSFKAAFAAVAAALCFAGQAASVYNAFGTNMGDQNGLNDNARRAAQSGIVLQLGADLGTPSTFTDILGQIQTLKDAGRIVVSDQDLALLNQAASMFSLPNNSPLTAFFDAIIQTSDSLRRFAIFFAVEPPATYPALLNSIDLDEFPPLLAQAAILVGSDSTSIPSIISTAAGIDLTAAAALINAGVPATVPEVRDALVGITNLSAAQARLGAGATTIVSVVDISAGFNVGNIVPRMGSSTNTIHALLVTLNGTGVGTHLNTSLTVLGIGDGVTHNIPGVLEAVAGISDGDLTSAQTLLGAPAKTPQSIISTA
ncbi:MAG: hypothetical protein LBL30_03435, partial [Holosporales bacterium]|nr:hypothetical protein [Holosporales bacterium]